MKCNKAKRIKCGLGHMVGPGMRPLTAKTRAGVERIARRKMSASEKRAGFVVVVADCGGYWRVSYAAQPFNMACGRSL